ncbi:oligopeptide:H+ symporter [Streptomyces sp. NPDC004838]
MSTEVDKPKLFAGLPRTLYPVAGLTVFDSTTFFALQSLLVYYIYFATDEGGLGFSVDRAISISAAFGACAYLATIVLGWFADRVFGAAFALRWGAWVAALGYFLLAVVPGPVGLAVGIIVVVLGAASMWVGESATVGGTLDAFPTKRESGFTIYYVGGATGAFVGVTLGGVLESKVGFSIGFIVSALTLAVGRLLYGPFRRGSEATAPRVDPQNRATRTQILGVTSAVLLCFAVLVGAVLLGFNPATLLGAAALVVAVVFFVRLLRDKSLTPEVRRGVLGYLPFFVATMVFNGLYQQLYSTVAVHSEESTDRGLFGWEVPPSTLLGAAPLCSIFLAPFLATLWGKLGDRQPRLGTKFGLSFSICSVGLLLLAVFSAGDALTPMFIVALIVFTFGAADVVVTPSGLALASRVGPEGYSTRMIAIQYLGIAGGIALAGTAGEWFVPGENEALYFGACAAVGAVVAVGMFATKVLGSRNQRGVQKEPAVL